MAMAVVKESVFRCSILLLIASLMVVSAAAAAGDKSDVRCVSLSFIPIGVCFGYDEVEA